MILPPLLNQAHKELISECIGQPNHRLFNTTSFLQRSQTSDNLWKKDRLRKHKIMINHDMMT